MKGDTVAKCAEGSSLRAGLSPLGSPRLDSVHSPHTSTRSSVAAPETVHRQLSTVWETKPGEMTDPALGGENDSNLHRFGVAGTYISCVETHFQEKVFSPFGRVGRLQTG